MPDGMGGGSFTNTLLDTISCAVWQNSANEQLVNDRLKNPSTHTLACAPSTKFAADNIAVIAGITYKLTKPNDILGKDELMTIGIFLDG